MLWIGVILDVIVTLSGVIRTVDIRNIVGTILCLIFGVVFWLVWRFKVTQPAKPLVFVASPGGVLIENREVPRARLFVSMLIWGMGVVAVIATLMISLNRMNKNIQRVVVPSTNTIRIMHPGNYVIYNEYQSIVNGEVFNESQEVNGLRVQVKDMQTGNTIPLVTDYNGSSYQFGPYAGVSLFTFHINHSGSIELIGSYGYETSGPQVVLSVTVDASGAMLDATIPGLALAAIAGLLGYYVIQGGTLEVVRKNGERQRFP